MPTTPTTHQLVFATIVLMVCLIAATLTRRSSVRESMQRQRDQLSITPGDGNSAHTWLDDSASFGANVVCFLWCILGTYLAIAIVLGNLLWVFSLFNH
jgi:hypothetical protein